MAKKTSANPTTRSLASSMETIEERTEELLEAVEAMQHSSSREFAKVWTTLGGIAGLDGLAVGLAEIAEVMGPLRSIVPPSTALELDPGVGEALAVIRDSLGGDRDSNFQQLATDYELPVSFIGQARPVVTGPYYEEQVA
ncbi:hypothetical protein KV102_18195 [Mumia sp. zg.B53]|uniref:hypothetical protein n=1 Tax=unclassified Mumia TaxID=2621872 RepID=UPI001C6F0E58|nr:MULTISPECIES: hypothetical protein [unclassified Mumia]MBW9206100.1 hypothetical protein [Mumia sp. zg.B17]MBW9211606.1 hypothetical protein [Mumia sp. zg.B21]MBW9216777.1 hypothetical protein [Mumia sp. zg.B53]MDD9348536.1 hypothetical protein [Mumia sp.]